jgi:glycosyltransferase involved in cell wall biosynthesis
MMQSRSSPFVSVIIPVFNDAEHLRLCLRALAQQTYPSSCYEVIVVDNGSDDLEAIQAVVAGFGQAIAVLEPTPGSYAARNRGIALAQGEILAFTDADCIPAPNWIETGVVHLLQTPNCGLVVGRIEIFFQNPDRPTWVEAYEQMAAFPQAEFVEKYKGGATANLFTFKQMVERAGGFNASLKSGGDLEWGRRVAALGYSAVYADDACIAHPARSSFAQLYQKTRRVAGGVYDLYMPHDAPSLKKVKTWLRLLWDDLALTIQSLRRLLHEVQFNQIQQKLGVSLVILGVGAISIWEKTRLQFGGVSSRG